MAIEAHLLPSGELRDEKAKKWSCQKSCRPLERNLNSRNVQSGELHAEKAALVIVSSAAIKIQPLIVALRTISMVSTEIRNDFIGKKFMVHKVGYPEESTNMPRSDMRGIPPKGIP